MADILGSQSCLTDSVAEPVWFQLCFASATYAVNRALSRDMSDLPNVVEVDQSSFQQLVVDKSAEMPVLVDFWADWCGPCKVLLPVLLKLVEEYQGKFQLAKVNTDLERELAQQQGIRSLPTLRLYKNGEVVDEILGAQPESAFRALLDEHIPRASDRLLEQALSAEAQGDIGQAVSLLEQAYRDAGEVMACNMMAQDTLEGVQAFLDKRPPDWPHRRD